MTFLSQKCKLLKRTVQGKEQVSELVVGKIQIGALKNYANSTVKNLRWSLFLIKQN